MGRRKLGYRVRYRVRGRGRGKVRVRGRVRVRVRGCRVLLWDRMSIMLWSDWEGRVVRRGGGGGMLEG